MGKKFGVMQLLMMRKNRSFEDLPLSERRLYHQQSQVHDGQEKSCIVQNHSECFRHSTRTIHKIIHEVLANNKPDLRKKAKVHKLFPKYTPLEQPVGTAFRKISKFFTKYMYEDIPTNTADGGPMEFFWFWVCKTAD